MSSGYSGAGGASVRSMRMSQRDHRRTHEHDRQNDWPLPQPPGPMGRHRCRRRRVARGRRVGDRPGGVAGRRHLLPHLTVSAARHPTRSGVPHRQPQHARPGVQRGGRRPGAQGDCNLPSDSTALQLNVTAVGASAPTYLTLFPGTGNPPNASHLNPTPGQPPTPNAVTVALDDGRFSIFNKYGTVDVIVDVVGAFARPDAANAEQC